MTELAWKVPDEDKTVTKGKPAHWQKLELYSLLKQGNSIICSQGITGDIRPEKRDENCQGRKQFKDPFLYGE